MTDTTDTLSKETLYQQMCTAYGGIVAFRGTILGLLPLLSGGATLLSLSLDQTKLALIAQVLPVGSLLAVLVTLGLFMYELRNINYAHELSKTGRAMEEAAGVEGMFTKQRSAMVISSRLAGCFVYSAVVSGWVFIGLYFLWSLLPAFIAAILVFVLMFLLTFWHLLFQIPGIEHQERGGLHPPAVQTQ